MGCVGEWLPYVWCCYLSFVQETNECVRYYDEWTAPTLKPAGQFKWASGHNYTHKWLLTDPPSLFLTCGNTHTHTQSLKLPLFLPIPLQAGQNILIVSQLRGKHLKCSNRWFHWPFDLSCCRYSYCGMISKLFEMRRYVCKIEVDNICSNHWANRNDNLNVCL